MSQVDVVPVNSSYLLPNVLTTSMVKRFTEAHQ